MEIKPLANLPDAERAREILGRLQREFLPISRARGYTVTSLSEMCCCGDAGRRGNGRGGGRPVSNNVWGYNQSHGRGAPCRISIRLRQPTEHGIILPYEHAAGTMAHELAHCVHGNHSAAFYRLMDEIAEQHADYVARGLVVDREGFPMGGESHTLGGRGQGAVRNTTANGGGANLREAVRKAAEERSKRPAPMKPQRLGTGNVVGGGSGGGGMGGIDPKLPPREAARLAAERRALLDSKWCLPCNEVIEILSDEEEEEEEEDNSGSGSGSCSGSNADKDAEEKKVAAKTKSTKDTNDDEGDITDLTASAEKKKSVDGNRKRATASGGTAAVPIDLTESPDRPPRKKKDSSSAVASAAAGTASTSAAAAATASCSSVEWACTACTLQNRPEALACDACGKARFSNGAEAAFAADAAMKRDEAIAAARQNEIRQSEDTFGGFNIYGTKKRETGTLPHLT